MAKHGENIKKRKDGRYEARYIKSKDVTGNVVWASVYGRTYREAKEKREDMLIQKKLSEMLKINDVLFVDIIESFLIQEKFRVKESTFAHYKNIIDAHIRPALGKYQSATLSSVDIENFAYRKLVEGRLDGTGGLSNKSVKDMLSILKRILKYGIDKSLVNEEVLQFSLPRSTKNKIQILKKDDVATLTHYTLKSDSLYAFGVYLCLYTGIRIGELCALRWNDINIETRTLHINKTMSRIYDTSQNATQKTKIIIDLPKTLSSDRIIPLPDFLIKAIKERQNYVKYEDAYFLTGSYEYIEPRTYYAKYKKILDECGLYPYSFHALRHTFATHCIEIGFDPKTLSELLGHSNVKVTLERYVHPSLELKRSYMELLA